MTIRFHVRLLRYGKLFKLSRALLWWEKLPVPALHATLRSCAQQGARMTVGEPVTLVAWVSPQGAWSSVEVEPVSAASSCLSEGLQSVPLPAPAGWDWARGAFALTLRVGAGRGRVDGVPVGD